MPQFQHNPPQSNNNLDKTSQDRIKKSNLQVGPGMQSDFLMELQRLAGRVQLGGQK